MGHLPWNPFAAWPIQVGAIKSWGLWEAKVLHPFAAVGRQALLVVVDAVALGGVLLPLPDEDVPVRMLELAEALREAVLPEADELGAIHPSLQADAMAMVASLAGASKGVRMINGCTTMCADRGEHYTRHTACGGGRSESAPRQRARV